MSKPVDILLCFDTTGSMYSVVDQVRARMSELAMRLFKEVPGVRIAIGVNGDYCDAPPYGPYVTKFLGFTEDAKTVTRFIADAQRTGGGGNGGEAYEKVFHEARSLAWRDGSRRAMVLVADEIPHTPQFRDNTQRLNWREEVSALGAMNVRLYGVQALDHPESRRFYPELAHMTGGFHLRLNQFSQITEILLAIGLQQNEETAPLDAFEEELKKRGLYSRAIGDVFDTLRGRKTSTADAMYGKADGLKLVSIGRFQALDVPSDATIRDFVEGNGLPFKKGRGFYEFTKRETIQDHKEVVLMDKKSGDMYTGKAAREMLHLPEFGSINISPDGMDKYTVFVQSTSVNRRLKGGTKFLYEVDGV